MALVGGTAGILVASGTNSLIAGAIPWALAPLGAGAVVCNVGTERPPRAGACRATMLGAFIGAAVGLLPGVLLVASAGSAPNTEDAYHTYVQHVLGGYATRSHRIRGRHADRSAHRLHHRRRDPAKCGDHVAGCDRANVHAAVLNPPGFPAQIVVQISA